MVMKPPNMCGAQSCQMVQSITLTQIPNFENLCLVIMNCGCLVEVWRYVVV